MSDAKKALTKRQRRKLAMALKRLKRDWAGAIPEIKKLKLKHVLSDCTAAGSFANLINWSAKRVGIDYYDFKGLAVDVALLLCDGGVNCLLDEDDVDECIAYVDTDLGQFSFHVFDEPVVESVKWHDYDKGWECVPRQRYAVELISKWIDDNVGFKKDKPTRDACAYFSESLEDINDNLEYLRECINDDDFECAEESDECWLTANEQETEIKKMKKIIVDKLSGCDIHVTSR